MDNPLKDCNLTNPECRDLGYCNGHETPNQPSNEDDDLRNEIFLDILHDTNANGAHVEAIIKLLQSHKERWQLEAGVEAVSQIYEKRRLIIPNEFESLYIVDANIIKEIRLELQAQLTNGQEKEKLS